ncbi:MAG: FAD-dependent oxidoreductase [Desulfarculus sp.]|nr:FAD-dependent oxidoreductase [Desulfarculus sp.]
MSERTPVCVVGAGAVGCAVALNLARQGREVFVLEKNSGVSQGENQSTRNSGVIHAGLYYDPETRPLKAGLCARGVEMLYDFCARHAVPHRRCGKLVVAVEEHEKPILELYRQRALGNQVPAEIISGARAREMEPQVKAVEALHLPTSGIIDAAAYVHRLYAQGSNAGATYLTQTSLSGVKATPEGLELTITYRDGATDSFLCGLLVNCGGLYSDEVARLVDPQSAYQIDPVRGEAAKFYRHKRPDLGLVGMNIYPTPQKLVTPQGVYFTVGVHLTPTLETGPDGQTVIGQVVTVCPLQRPARDKEEFSGEYRPMKDFLDKVSAFFPGLRLEDLEPHQVGIQARMVGHQDWVLEFSPREPRCLNLLGIDSPGLTASLALAERVEQMLDQDGR